jgi:hypothetical protein
MFPDLVNKMRVHPDPRINLQIIELYKKQLKQVPGSKLHRETSAEIQKLLKMPAPKTEKEKLQAKTVDQLKRQAKKVGANVIDPKTGKAKTKEQLVNSIVMKLRLSGQSDRQTGKSNTAKDATRQAKAPGKRTSAKGKVYYERRANRSDAGLLLGEKFKYRYITAESWRKTPADYKTVINGVKYKMVLDGDRGTILAPVKIKKS